MYSSRPTSRSRQGNLRAPVAVKQACPRGTHSSECTDVDRARLRAIAEKRASSLSAGFGPVREAENVLDRLPALLNSIDNSTTIFSLPNSVWRHSSPSRRRRAVDHWFGGRSLTAGETRTLVSWSGAGSNTDAGHVLRTFPSTCWPDTQWGRATAIAYGADVRSVGDIGVGVQLEIACTLAYRAFGVTTALKACGREL